MSDEHKKDDFQIGDSETAIRNLEWRDEVLQVMYWMAGEGFGHEFSIADLQKFLSAPNDVLEENLEQMISTRLLERVGADNYALTDQGKREGGRRFADEFENLMKPGHFECDEVDCDCHNADSLEPCKNFHFAAALPEGHLN